MRLDLFGQMRTQYLECWGKHGGLPGLGSQRRTDEETLNLDLEGSVEVCQVEKVEGEHSQQREQYVQRDRGRNGMECFRSK